MTLHSFIATVKLKTGETVSRQILASSREKAHEDAFFYLRREGHAQTKKQIKLKWEFSVHSHPTEPETSWCKTALEILRKMRKGIKCPR